MSKKKQKIKLSEKELYAKRLVEIILKIQQQTDPKVFEKVVHTKLAEYVIETEKVSTKKLRPKKVEWVHPLIPKNNFVLLTGEKASGKTAFCLNLMDDFIKQGKKVCFFEGHETTREYRIDPFLKKRGYKEVPENLEITKNRLKIIAKFHHYDYIFVDAISEFLMLKSTLDQPEVAKKLGWLNFLCQQNDTTLIGCHYQTKTSQKEVSVKMKSGGSMTWINVPRVCLLLVKKPKKKNEKQKSVIMIQECNLERKIKEKVYHLGDNFQIEESSDEDPQEFFEKHIALDPVKKSEELHMKRIVTIVRNNGREIGLSSLKAHMFATFQAHERTVRRAVNKLISQGILSEERVEFGKDRLLVLENPE